MKGALILHVDDDSNDLMLVEHACRKGGFSVLVHPLNDGDQALAYLAGRPPFEDRDRHPLPSLVLLDLKMPRVNGFDVLTWIRSESHLRSMPVVVLTSSSHDEDIRKAYELGANSYLVKPVSFESLYRLLSLTQEYWLHFNRIPNNVALPQAQVRKE